LLSTPAKHSKYSSNIYQSLCEHFLHEDGGAKAKEGDGTGTVSFETIEVKEQTAKKQRYNTTVLF
jgi:hypothetical protein